MFQFDSAEALVLLAQKSKLKISEVVVKQQIEEQGRTAEELYDRMKKLLYVMKDSVKEGLDPDIRSNSKLSGGDSYKLAEFSKTKKSLFSGVVSNALTMAMAVSECNACMGKIVASPTAGSSGIVPACVLSMLGSGEVSEKEAVMSLFCASGFGMIIASKASIAGASGGCQAECGTAAAMAAAALCEMRGASPSVCSNAAAFAIESFLGLICDPVAGLVEIPCIKRNVSCTAVAFSSAQMALAGIELHIPTDEVISAMKEVGDTMPVCYKETAAGGLAATPTAKKIQKEIFKD
jgi:L-serine dehydratase